eukprot:216254_1
MATLTVIILLFALGLCKAIDSNVTASCPYSSCVQVTNRCPNTLYLQRTTVDGPEGNPTKVTTANSGQTVILDISGWKINSGQRLYAWWANPVGKNLNGMTQRDKVEINHCNNNPNTMCYNPTAVDYFGLPVNIGPVNANDCSNIPVTGSGKIKVSTIRSGCPTQFISTPPYGVCQSPGALCSYNKSAPICSALDPTIKQCVSDGHCQSGVTTPQCYGCSGWFSQQPEWCAALNRGMYGPNAGNQNDPSQFYKNAPYNTYASWIHTGLAKEYAFPYDDYQGNGASGYNSCSTNFLAVTFCPSG